MSKHEANAAARTTTVTTLPLTGRDGKIEIPMSCPKCGGPLMVRDVFKGKAERGGSLPVANAYMWCERSCDFEVDVRIDVDMLLVRWRKR